MTRATLAHLMTPALPPFYRLFMGGLVPSPERGDPQWLKAQLAHGRVVSWMIMWNNETFPIYNLTAPAGM